MTNLDVFTDSGEPWFSISMGWEVMDYSRIQELKPQAYKAEIDLRVDMALRGRLRSAGVEKVWVIFVLQRPEDLTRPRPRYRREGEQLTVTIYAADDDRLTGDEFGNWMETKMAQAIQSWNGLPPQQPGSTQD